MDGILDVYIIPFGLEDDGRTVRATLVFRPGVPAKPAERPNPGGKAAPVVADETATTLLYEWPKAIGSMKDLVLNVYKADATGGRDHGQEPIASGAVSLASLKVCYEAAGLGRDPLEKLNRLWKRVLAPEQGLASKLVVSPQATAAALAPVAQEGKPEVPDIMSPPRAELAHLLTLHRAMVIKTRVDKGTVEPRGTADPAPLWATSPATDQKHAMQDGAAVLGRSPDGTPIVAAVALCGTDAAPAQALDPGKTKTQQDLREWLGKERAQSLIALESWADEQTTDLKPARPRQYSDRITTAERDGSVSAIKNAREIQYGKDEITKLPRGVQRARTQVQGGFEAARQDSLTTHFHSNIEDGKAFARRFVDGLGDLPPADDAAERWAALLALPSLQRLFHLAIDVSIPLKHDLPSDGFFVFELSLKLRSATLRRFATLAKTSRDGTPRLFPCTREECVLAQQKNPPDLRTNGAVDQINGLLDLESSILFEDKTQSYRFSLASLDVHGAAETEIQRDRAIAHVKDMANALNLTREMACALDVSADDAAAERKLRTAGLQLIDQWRDSIAIKQYVRALMHAKGVVGVEILDADDLAVGLRLDLGGKAVGSGLSWACLTDRRVAFGDPTEDHRFDFERAVNAFTNRPDCVDRDRASLDGVVIGQPTRLLADDATRADGKVVAFAEPIVASWDGDLLGMRSGRAQANAQGDYLQLSMSFDLRNREKGDRGERLPFRQRLGAPTWIGARMVLLGGVALPLAEAQKLYKAGFALPREEEFRRVLRHEWIDPPAIATPWETAHPEYASGRGLDGERLVVRSGPCPKDPAETEDAWRYLPRETRRVVFAPRVDFTFAHLHGVFDGAENRSRLLGGMRLIDYDAEKGGFPAYSPTFPLEAGPRFGAKPQTPKDNFANAPCDPPPGGLAVFRLRKNASTSTPNGDCAANRYFPDPAARYLVVALGRVEPDAAPLTDAPFVFPIYPGHPDGTGVQTPGYPHAAPLMIRVVAHAMAKPVTCHKDFSARGGGRRPTASLNPKATKGPENQLQELVLPLAPGEEFVAKIWALPSSAQIGAWFDAPESMAFLDATPPTYDEPCARREDMRVGLGAINAQAKKLHEALCQRPVPEFAAVRELRLVHAVERPKAPPVLHEPEPRPNGPDRRPLVWRRVNADRANKILAGAVEPPAVDDPDASEVLAFGDLDIDRPSSDTVELWVEAASPSGHALDDPLRGRSPEDRTRGDWPRQPSGPLDVPASRLLYGFDVAADGRIGLHRQTAIFARWPLQPGVSATETLLTLQRSTADSGTIKQNDKVSRPGLQRLFSDNGARRVRVWLETTSRTARLIPERRAYPDADQTAHDKDRRKLASNCVETILRSVVRPAALPVKSLLPAFFWDTKAGAAERVTRIRVPFARPAMTSGVDERVGIVLWPPNLRRITSTFPKKPDLAAGTVLRTEPLAENDPREIVLTDLEAQGGESWRRKGEIADDDLGPGGSYVTRWGADPVEAAGTMTWLIDYKAFQCGQDTPSRPVEPIDSLDTAGQDTLPLWPEQDTYRPRLVENVLMPVPLGVDDDGPDDKAEALAAANGKSIKPPPTPTQFLMVSLMTYAPRFDVDSETWYVDIDIDPGVAPDPFLRLGLVRFQPHADRVLQVSFPVAEWVQVVGHRRSAEIQIRGRDETKRPAKIAVEINYPVLADDSGLSPLHVFSATLIERFRLSSGLVVERAGACKASDDRNATDSSGAPNASSDKTAWSVEFDLLRPKEVSFVGYAVYLEERLRMKRAGADSEPVVKESELPWQDSGPRFAVKLDVPEA